MDPNQVIHSLSITTYQGGPNRGIINYPELQPGGGGWSVIRDESLSLIDKWGHGGTWLHNPFGTNNNQMDFAQYIDALNTPNMDHLWYEFHTVWQTFTKDHFLGCYFGQLGYANFPMPTWVTQAIENDKLDDLASQLVRSLSPALSVRAHIGIDSSNQYGRSEGDWRYSFLKFVASILQTQGRNLFVEAIPNLTDTHWHNTPSVGAVCNKRFSIAGVRAWTNPDLYSKISGPLAVIVGRDKNPDGTLETPAQVVSDMKEVLKHGHLLLTNIKRLPDYGIKALTDLES